MGFQPLRKPFSQILLTVLFGLPLFAVENRSTIKGPYGGNHLLTSSNSSGFESTDGGATWSPFSTTAGRQVILLAFDPSTNGRIYNSSADAIERSNDGGKIWFSLSTGLGKSHGNIFVISPSGNSLFAGGATGGVWVFHSSRSRAVGR